MRLHVHTPLIVQVAVNIPASEDAWIIMVPAIAYTTEGVQELRWRLVALLGLTLLIAGWIAYRIYKSGVSDVTPEDIRQFSKQLAAAFMTGKYSLYDSLGIVAQQTPNPKLKGAILDVRSRLSHKGPFYEAMAQYPEVFSSEFVFAVKYGAQMACVNSVLLQLSREWPDDPHQRWDIVRGIIKRLAVEKLNDSDPFVRRWALRALAEVRAKESIPHILPLLNDPHPKVREETKKTLQQLGYKSG